MTTPSSINIENRNGIEFIDLKKILLFVLISSFFVGYFQDYVSIISDGISLIIFLVVIGYYTIQKKISKLDLKVFKVVCVVLLIFFIVSINNFYFYKTYLFLFTIIVVFLLLRKVAFTIREYIYVHNVAYIAYLFLSGLLYFEIIGSGKDINAFPASFMGWEFVTFYGFHGSTASVDSYSIITALLNLVYNRNMSGILIITVSLIIAAGTFRTTPLLAIIVPCITLGLVKIFGKKSLILWNAVLFLSFLTPLLITNLLQNNAIDLFLNYATTGRAFLWSNYIQEYLKQEYVNFIIGMGNTTSIEVTAWKTGISNPHNSFFTFLISFGIILYVFLYLVITKKLLTCSYKSMFLIFAVLTVCVSNGVIFSFSGTHFIILAMVLLIDNEKIKLIDKFSLKKINLLSYSSS